MKFLSTPSARRATGEERSQVEQLKFLSTPSARRATSTPRVRSDAADISIHALREEGDSRTSPAPPTPSNFYPRPPRGGRLSQMFLQCRLRNFYPRPPRGGRPTGRKARNINKLFLSTPSASLLGHFCISIHALREEGDRHGPAAHRGGADFYPRPPRGGRLPAVDDALHIPVISIHALREEGDRHGPAAHRGGADFYPRPPRGGRLPAVDDALHIPVISIHALREEGDLSRSPRTRRTANFYPRPPRGGRQQKQRQNLYFQTNYTTFCTNLEEP